MGNKNKEKDKVTVSQKIKKYGLSRNALIVIGILMAVLFVVYIFLNIYGNTFSIEAMVSNSVVDTKEMYKKINTIDTLKNVLLVIDSFLFTSFFSSLLIDIKNKNSVVSDLLVNDLFVSNEFYDLMTDDNKQKILSALERNIYFNKYNVLEDMYKHTKNTIQDTIEHSEYYFESCTLDAQCDINLSCSFIEKRIIKTVRIKPYKSTHKLSEYPIVSCSYIENSSYDPIKIEKLYIGGKRIEINSQNIKPDIEDCDIGLESQCGYNKRKKFIYQRIIDLSSKKATEIKVEYVTKTPISDGVYTFRLMAPCKSFDFDFYFKQGNEKYSLSPIAFGFVDDANETPNAAEDNSRVKASFDNWIFTCDGVAIVIGNKYNVNNNIIKILLKI